MKKSIFLFVMTTVLSIGAIVYGCIFVKNQTSEAVLTEETIAGDRKAAEDLTVGFRADSGDDLHWINSYDYSTDKSESAFKRGEMLEAAEPSIYDEIRRDKTFGKGDLTKTVKTSLYEDIRFTGWDIEPFTTKLDYDGLGELQKKKIQIFYDELQQKVVESGGTEQGRIRLKDHMEYYPVSFRFQLGVRRLDSGSALIGLKVYDSQGMLSSENSAVYDEDVALYATFNRVFRIPVIENEYQEYTVSKVEEYDPETSLGYTTDVKKPLGAGEDYYEFDPVIVIQEKRREEGAEQGQLKLTGSQHETKNRILFIVNNRTAKGAPVDVSQIRGGYGVYELPIAADTKAKKIGHRVVTVSAPTPLPDQMTMVYPLDETAEYVEMSLSRDDKYLAVFSIKDGRYFVDMIDANTWTSQGPTELFSASEKMTYAWGDDGSLAVTNHQGYVAVLCRADRESTYRLIYSGKAAKGSGGSGNDFCEVFFDTEMFQKKNSYVKYQYRIDEGLAIAAKDGKIALVQNKPVRLSNSNNRAASLECAVIDESGVIYRGRLNSNMTDLDNDMGDAKRHAVEGILREERKDNAMNHMIYPVMGENWVAW